MSVSDIFGEFQLLGKVMDLRLENHGVIASNIANVDTPHYKAVELEFDSALQAALEPGPTLRLKTDNPRHLQGMAPESIDDVTPREFYTSPSTVGNDRNTVDIDREMTKLNENSLIYRAAVQIAEKKFSDLTSVIAEGGR